MAEERHINMRDARTALLDLDTNVSGEALRTKEKIHDQKEIDSLEYVSVFRVHNPGGYFWRNGVHLRDNIQIRAVYIENPGTTQTITLTPPGSPQVLGTVAPGKWCRFLLEDGHFSVNLSSPAAENTAFIIFVITNHFMDPNRGTL